MSTGARIGLGALIGLALGVAVSVATEIPFAPQLGAIIGRSVGWMTRQNRG